MPAAWICASHVIAAIILFNRNVALRTKEEEGKFSF
jgi:hypothetical protein